MKFEVLWGIEVDVVVCDWVLRIQRSLEVRFGVGIICLWFVVEIMVVDEIVDKEGME